MLNRNFYVTSAAALLFLVVNGSSVHAQISYGTSGATITEGFDGFPTDIPNNASIESVYTNGWQDNASTVSGDHLGLTGWYLWHPLDPGSENGVNGHQRVRAGVGANTGAFWLFSNTNSANTEKALGAVGSTTVAGNGADMWMAMRLTNNTGVTLNTFTVTYDGEEWRDGQSTAGETLSFAYNVGATEADWKTSSFTPVPALSFTSPTISGTGSSGTPIDGNAGANRIADITSTIFGVTWDPGTDLWLRWADPQLASNADDGLAIDNVRFVAPGTGSSPDINSFQSGNASAGSTWVGGQPPATGNTYHVMSGHTVTVDAAFAGTVLKAENGGTIDIGTGGNGQHIQYMIIESSADLTESVSGDFSLGDPTNSNETVELKRDVTFTVDPGAASATCDLCLNMKMTGPGNVTINSADDSSVSIKKASTLGGTVIFNGTGDTVKIDGSENTARLQMNSTGDNRVQYINGGVATNLTFNQPGIVDHLTTVTRLQGPSTLVANANITVNETTGFPNNTSQSDERRYLPGAIQGPGNITVNGTAANYTNSNGSVLLNEFELGGTPQPTGNLSNSTFRGTITANDYLNVEMRENTARVAFVINANSRLEYGAQVAHANPAKLLSTGQITVNSGGTLEVGFEEGGISGSPFYSGGTAGSGHHAYHLNITSLGGRSGGLTMNAGSTMRMQINGDPTTVDQWDSISATGNVVLTGSTIDLLINPQSTSATDQNGAYNPAIGDKFDIITIAPAPVPGDYDRDNDVDEDDYTVWRGVYGTTTGFQAADGNNNAEVDLADYVVWREHVGQTPSVTGTITGTPTLNILDPQGWLVGVTFSVTNLGNKLQLEVVSAGAFTAVPEPSTLGLVAVLGFLGLGGARRRRAAA